MKISVYKCTVKKMWGFFDSAISESFLIEQEVTREFLSVSGLWIQKFQLRHFSWFTAVHKCV